MGVPIHGGIVGDANLPTPLIVPSWGPDGLSRRMAAANTQFANPVSPANISIGVRPAPAGADAFERSKSTAYLPAQQQFRGLTQTIVDPATLNVVRVASFPAASVQINPVLLTLGTRPDGS